MKNLKAVKRIGNEGIMIIKLFVTILFFLPPVVLFLIVDTDTSYSAVSEHLGMKKHVLGFIFLLFIIFLILRFLFNKLLNKKHESAKIDFVLNKQSLISGTFAFVYMSLTFVVMTFSQDLTTYGSWLRGMKEIEVVKEVLSKSSREQEYIIEALKIAEDSNSNEVKELTMNYYNKFRKIEACLTE